jgi:hypothetical protein
LKEAQTTAFCTPPIEKKIYNYNSDFWMKDQYWWPWQRVISGKLAWHSQS